MIQIKAIEDVNGFWKERFSSPTRNKFFKVEINGKVYDRMELTYTIDYENGETFVFTQRAKGDSK